MLKEDGAERGQEWELRGGVGEAGSAGVEHVVGVGFDEGVEGGGGVREFEEDVLVGFGPVEVQY